MRQEIADGKVVVRGPCFYHTVLQWYTRLEYGGKGFKTQRFDSRNTVYFTIIVRSTLVSFASKREYGISPMKFEGLSSGSSGVSILGLVKNTWTASLELMAEQIARDETSDSEGQNKLT